MQKHINVCMSAYLLPVIRDACNVNIVLFGLKVLQFLVVNRFAKTCCMISDSSFLTRSDERYFSVIYTGMLLFLKSADEKNDDGAFKIHTCFLNTSE